MFELVLQMEVSSDEPVKANAPLYTQQIEKRSLDYSIYEMKSHVCDQIWSNSKGRIFDTRKITTDKTGDDH